MGVNLRITDPILLHLLSCVEYHLYLLRDNMVFRGVGDIWIPKLAVSPNHFVRLYIPGVEDLFQEGDHILRVEHGGSRSRLIS